MHNDVDDLIKSALNSKLLSINLNSQCLDKKKQEVKNIVEQPTERGTQPEYSLSMGYKHLNTTPETESDEIIKSGVEKLVPIPREYEVTFEYKNECDVPDFEDSSTFDVCKDHFEILSDSNNDDISSDDDAFEDIEYVEASLLDSELVSLEEENVRNKKITTFEMSRDVLTVGSTMRILLLYRGEYSQWVERFMNYHGEQTDGKAMINSIKNGDQPLPRVTQVSIAGTTSTEQPPLKDKSMWSNQEKRVQKIDRLARYLLIQGLPNDIYSLIDSNKTAKDLWDALTRHMLGLEYGEQDRKAAVLYEYETFKATEGELLLDT
uniref:Integrase, catalytic region, zinc finger, CCHC-type, peptidase aspartic, catalytic n=1 Tax=Tanacetum cinerariifolium TaxID=118510 RepID=A0A6L2M948_TANCI|nr:hypothetical protein [Tanacetum cinerariifolium]